MANFTPTAIFQVLIGLTIIVWYGWGLHYRLLMARKYDIGLLDVSLPDWHENASFPLIILLCLSLFLSWYFG